MQNPPYINSLKFSLLSYVNLEKHTILTYFNFLFFLNTPIVPTSTKTDSELKYDEL